MANYDVNNDLGLTGGMNGAFIARLADAYAADPASVGESWRAFFDGNGRQAPAAPRPDVRHGVGRRAADKSRSDTAGVALLQDRVDQLVRSYRARGHRIAKIDPLGLPRPAQPELAYDYFGLTEADLDREVSSRTVGGPDIQTLRDVLARLQETYCRSIGVQFMHIDDLGMRMWLQDRMESTANHIDLSREQQVRILARLIHASIFERLLQKKYVGAKTFSLEGSESLIPLLDMAIEHAGGQGIREIVIGMAHRGRLNVLANIMNKPAADLFREFDDSDPEARQGSGDVKYHLGHSTDWQTAGGQNIHLSLCFNPSHLEFINTVALGRMRAKQDRAGDVDRETGLVLLIHGDAAFAGEGIVQETLNLSELPGYRVGGTLHVIVNNQIGFTTSPGEGRSCIYATDVAKMLQIPIFHVNGEDPEAVAQAVTLAMDYRREFKRDVIIDMYGFRKLGHNEVDEPSFTQPLMYEAIRNRKSVKEHYLECLLRMGQITRQTADDIAAAYHDEMEKGLSIARSEAYKPPDARFTGIWSSYHGGPARDADDVDTGVAVDRLSALLRRMSAVPEGFHRHPRLSRFVEHREKMASGEAPLDWAAAEGLAIASLAVQGIRVRLTGQDSGRGTFSQRHAVFHDVQSGEPYLPWRHLQSDQAPVEVRNSPLSEAGVLGFEYGYSLDCPDGLVMWEAQFGDFVNAAQVIIDQFIVSSEDKRRRLSGLVLLLPHGFEGQGPEHSSAYIERFLTQCAEDNVQVAHPSTPAQMFHLLRRQALRKWRKPLVVFTPKSLLRHPAAVSSLAELAAGRYQNIIPDSEVSPARVSRVLMCAGKVYYELLARREENGRRDVAIVRVEQYYPFDDAALAAALAAYRPGTPVIWVQEEPANMGAWRFLHSRWCDRMLGKFPFEGRYRPESASPATGSSSTHKREQETLVNSAFE